MSNGLLFGTRKATALTATRVLEATDQELAEMATIRPKWIDSPGTDFLAMNAEEKATLCFMFESDAKTIDSGIQTFAIGYEQVKGEKRFFSTRNLQVGDECFVSLITSSNKSLEDVVRRTNARIQDSFGANQTLTRFQIAEAIVANDSI